MSVSTPIKMKKKVIYKCNYYSRINSLNITFDRKIEEIDLKMTKFVGTPNCMSPEVLSRKNYDFKVT